MMDFRSVFASKSFPKNIQCIEPCLEVTEVHGGVAGEVGAGHDASSDLALRVGDLAQLSVLRGDLAEVLQFSELAASAGAVGLHAGQERVLKYFLTGRDWTGLESG